MDGQAAVCYQASLSLNSKQADAATQLGYVFLKLDRTAEAESWLVASAQIKPQAAVYQNLAEVYRRRGDVQASQWAFQQLAAVKQGSPTTGAVPPVQRVEPAAFAAMSPYNPWGPGASTIPASQAASPMVQPAPPPPSRTANAWFGTRR
jgi:tetratricopeptide (TPR) repeat protein